MRTPDAHGGPSGGVSVAELIERQGALAPEAALTVFKGMLLALAAVHRSGLGHGGCEPGSVLVDAAGLVTLDDVGTPRYLAPEIRQGESATPGSDLYAATATFFECLTGHPAEEQHAGGSGSLDPAVEPLRPLIDEGMAFDRAARPHSAIAFVSELEAMAPGACGADWEERGRDQLAAAVRSAAGRGRRPAPVGGTPAAARGNRRPRPRRLLAAAAAVLVAVGVAAAITLSGSHHQARLSGSPSPARATSAPAQSLSPATSAVPARSPSSSRSPAPSATASARLTVISDAPASAQVGAGYSGTVTVSGGSGGYTWGVTGLPPGLTASSGGPNLTVSGSRRWRARSPPR